MSSGNNLLAGLASQPTFTLPPLVPSRPSEPPKGTKRAASASTSILNGLMPAVKRRRLGGAQAESDISILRRADGKRFRALLESSATYARAGRKRKVGPLELDDAPNKRARLVGAAEGEKGGASDDAAVPRDEMVIEDKKMDAERRRDSGYASGAHSSRVLRGPRNAPEMEAAMEEVIGLLNGLEVEEEKTSKDDELAYFITGCSLGDSHPIACFQGTAMPKGTLTAAEIAAIEKNRAAREAPAEKWTHNPHEVVIYTIEGDIEDYSSEIMRDFYIDPHKRGFQILWRDVASGTSRSTSDFDRIENQLMKSDPEFDEEEDDIHTKVLKSQHVREMRARLGDDYSKEDDEDLQLLEYDEDEDPHEHELKIPESKDEYCNRKQLSMLHYKALMPRKPATGH